MKKLVITLLAFLTLTVQGQQKIDLMPTNAEKYIGKITREDFEVLVGEPLEEVEGQVTYNVIMEYDNIPTTIWCTYYEGVLVGMSFPTPHFLGYWIDFYSIQGFPKMEKVAKQKGLHISERDAWGRLYRVKLRIRHFGMTIMDIKNYRDLSTAVINYYKF